MKIEGEEKYFTAQDAKKVSMEMRNNKLNEELDEIYKLINDTRFNGKYIITLNKVIDKEIQIFLENKGFDVKTFAGNQWDPSGETKISW